MSEYRSLDGELKVLRKKNEWVYEVELWLLNDNVNRNNWKYINLEKHIRLFAGTPLLVAYVNDGKTIGDGHNMKVTKDPVTGEPRASFTDATAERIVGALSDNPEDLRFEVDERGNKWIVGKGYLWRWYAGELVEKIKKDAIQGRSMSVSIETLVTQSRTEGDVEIEEEYEILGTTILGDHVMPAVADARIVALNGIKEQFNELKIRAASYQNTKPQQKNNKGVNKTLEKLNTKQTESLSSKFNGYHVLAAFQDANCIRVCLLSSDGCPAIYNMESLNDAVTESKIERVNANTVFRFAEECEAEVDTTDVLGVANNELATARTERDNAISERDTANSQLNAMRDAESKRRVAAAKATALNTLNAFNAKREAKVDEKEISKVNTDIEAGLYTNSVNADGEWIGDKQVADAVFAVCGRAVMAMDKDAHAKNNSIYLWPGNVGTEETHDDSLEGQLSSWGL